MPRGIPDCGVATRRDPIPFETRDERRDKKSGKILMMIDRSDGVQQLILNPPEGRFILAM